MYYLSMKMCKIFIYRSRFLFFFFLILYVYNFLYITEVTGVTRENETLK